MSNAKKITIAFLTVVLLAGIFLVVFIQIRPFFTQPDNFVIIPAFEAQADYIAAVRADPSADKDALYKKYVADRYGESCLYSGLLTPSMTRPTVGHPIGDLDQLAENVRILRESDIVQVAKTTLQQAAALLPGSKITVCLFAADPTYQSVVSLFMHGLYALANDPSRVVVEVVPQGDWHDLLSYTFAHEYHHTIYIQRLPTPQSDPVPKDLLDNLLCEGRADSFAHLLYPNVGVSRVNALTPEEEAAQWQAIQAGLTNTSYSDFQRFLFGDGDKIPTWTGYTIGFHIVQKYIHSHPNASPAEWTTLDADKLLAESGYTGRP
jgi:uncharacterized protein YjaZ